MRKRERKENLLFCSIFEEKKKKIGDVASPLKS